MSSPPPEPRITQELIDWIEWVCPRPRSYEHAESLAEVMFHEGRNDILQMLKDKRKQQQKKNV